ncbi:hypothetical protein G6F54_014522 [Rhizopus delemar]|nr:hypothetical protein G6F54_014522 [Rhizopus delemar]
MTRSAARRASAVAGATTAAVNVPTMVFSVLTGSVTAPPPHRPCGTSPTGRRACVRAGRSQRRAGLPRYC